MRSVQISTSARLHFGFLDLHGGCGRRFGSLGLALDQPRTTLILQTAQSLTVEETIKGNTQSAECQRAARYARNIMKMQAYHSAASIKILEAIPPHAGLGSGTKLALAVGTGLALLNKKPPTFDDTGIRLLERGRRSGIGLSTFANGGLILDGGQRIDNKKTNKTSTSPPLIARLPFPEDWRIILIFDPRHQGIHGSHEQKAFHQLAPYPAGLAADLCRLVVMQILPAVCEADLPAFGQAINALQAAVGDHFSSAQKGRYTSPHVARVLTWLAKQGVTGYGQSSWGPTGFAFTETEDHAHWLINTLQEKRIGCNKVSFMICRARNSGYEATTHQTLLSSTSHP